MRLAQVVTGASEHSLLLAYRSISEDHLRWRYRGGDVGGAFFGLALLSVSPARGGTLRVCFAGVLGGSRNARAAGSSPATSKTCLVVCCSGAAGAATFGVAAPPEGGAGAEACCPRPGRRGQRGALLRAVLGALGTIDRQKFKSGPVRIVVRQRASFKF